MQLKEENVFLNINSYSSRLKLAVVIDIIFCCCLRLRTFLPSFQNVHSCIGVKELIFSKELFASHISFKLLLAMFSTGRKNFLQRIICFLHKPKNAVDNVLQSCKNLSSPWSVISLYGLGCNIVLQLGDLFKGVNGGL